MLTIQSGPSATLARRQLLQAGGAGLLGLSLPKLLAAEELQTPLRPRAKSVIFLFLFGGPSQLETFDLKPDAPAEARGPFKEIASRTPGLRICEHLHRTAAVSDKFCVVKTLSHNYNDHSTAAHYMQTGHPWHIAIGAGFNATEKDWPSMGSVVEYMAQRDGALRDLPSYAVVPNFLGRMEEFSYQLIRPGEYAGWLGRAYEPLTTSIDKRDKKDNPYTRPCTDDELRYQIQGLVSHEELSLDRLHGRKSLLEQFDANRRAMAGRRVIDEYNRFEQRAFGLVTSDKTRHALDIRQEPDALRDRYGRHLFGQSTLMARRLVEAGVRFCTVHWETVDGYGWDSHIHSNDVRDHLIPGFDQALSSLLADLDDRGLLDETLVVALGEMGRTPKATPAWGRGHWSMLFPVVLAGAGIRGGTVHGTTDKDAAYANERPVKPEDLAATIYHALGIDHEMRVTDPSGRPTPIVDGGRPLLELFG
ncbi:MAG: DUF1501 domain-containing protein [Pirellulales bacterium]